MDAHYVSCRRFVDGGASTNATFKLGHKNINWILPWGIETLVFLETKGLQSQQIDWLVWKLITTIVKHYTHMAKMKKYGFIKK
jgi:hypothetical protein